jgi:hypothetical protein
MAEHEKPFYASPAEQRSWLLWWFRQEGAWICVSYPGSSSAVSLLDADGIEQLPLETRQAHACMLFLGQKDLAEPVYRPTADGRREIDLPASLGVQMAPCFWIGHLLLEGRFAVLREAEYRRRELPAEAARTLFSRVVTSFRKHGADPTAILYQQVAGERKLHRRVLVSRDVATSANALVLKQFPDGAVEFGITRPG